MTGSLVTAFSTAVVLLQSGSAHAAGNRCITIEKRSVCVEGPSKRNLVVYLHGYGASGSEDVLGLRRLADVHQFLYAAPDAAAEMGGLGEWRPGDIAFIEELIRRIVALDHADPERVYLVGFSLGGFLALEFACAHPNAIAAAVSVSGTRFAPAAKCVPGTVSTLHVHGDEDATVHPDGGVGRRTGQAYLSARNAASLAAAAAGCRSPVEPAGALTLGGEIERAGGCRSGSAVELWFLRGMRHVPTVSGLNEAIWGFLQRVGIGVAARKQSSERPNRN